MTLEQIIITIIGIAVIGLIAYGVKRAVLWADEKNMQIGIEKQMRQQLKEAEYERVAAQKIARERGWDK